MKTERIIAWLIVVVAIFGPNLVKGEVFTVSHEPVTTYTDGSPIEASKMVYYTMYLSDDESNLAKWTVVDRSTATSHQFNTSNYGLILDQVVWAAGVTELSSGEKSVVSPPYLWIVGHTDTTAPQQVRLKKVNPTTIAMSWSANPAFTADRWEILYSTTSYKDLLDAGTSMIVPLSQTSQCFTVPSGAREFYAVVRARNGATEKTGFSKVGFWLRGNIIGADAVATARVNGLDLGALGRWFDTVVTHQAVDCGTDFQLLDETEQQRASLRKGTTINGLDQGELGSNFNGATH